MNTWSYKTYCNVCEKTILLNKIEPNDNIYRDFYEYFRNVIPKGTVQNNIDTIIKRNILIDLIDCSYQISLETIHTIYIAALLITQYPINRLKEEILQQDNLEEVLYQLWQIYQFKVKNKDLEIVSIELPKCVELVLCYIDYYYYYKESYPKRFEIQNKIKIQFKIDQLVENNNKVKHDKHDMPWPVLAAKIEYLFIIYQLQEYDEYYKRLILMFKSFSSHLVFTIHLVTKFVLDKLHKICQDKYDFNVLLLTSLMYVEHDTRFLLKMQEHLKINPKLLTYILQLLDQLDKNEIEIYNKHLFHKWKNVSIIHNITNYVLQCNFKLYIIIYANYILQFAQRELPLDFITSKYEFNLPVDNSSLKFKKFIYSLPSDIPYVSKLKDYPLDDSLIELIIQNKHGYKLYIWILLNTKNELLLFKIYDSYYRLQIHLYDEVKLFFYLQNKSDSEISTFLHTFLQQMIVSQVTLTVDFFREWIASVFSYEIKYVLVNFNLDYKAINSLSYMAILNNSSQYFLKQTISILLQLPTRSQQFYIHAFTINKEIKSALIENAYQFGNLNFKLSTNNNNNKEEILQTKKNYHELLEIIQPLIMTSVKLQSNLPLPMIYSFNRLIEILHPNSNVVSEIGEMFSIIHYYLNMLPCGNDYDRWKNLTLEQQNEQFRMKLISNYSIQDTANQLLVENNNLKDSNKRFFDVVFDHPIDSPINKQMVTQFLYGYNIMDSNIYNIEPKLFTELYTFNTNIELDFEKIDQKTTGIILNVYILNKSVPFFIYNSLINNSKILLPHYCTFNSMEQSEPDFANLVIELQKFDFYINLNNLSRSYFKKPIEGLFIYEVNYHPNLVIKTGDIQEDFHVQEMLDINGPARILFNEIPTRVATSHSRHYNDIVHKQLKDLTKFKNQNQDPELENIEELLDSLVISTQLLNTLARIDIDKYFENEIDNLYSFSTTEKIIPRSLFNKFIQYSNLIYYIEKLPIFLEYDLSSISYILKKWYMDYIWSDIKIVNSKICIQQLFSIIDEENLHKLFKTHFLIQSEVNLLELLREFCLTNSQFKEWFLNFETDMLSTELFYYETDDNNHLYPSILAPFNEAKFNAYHDDVSTLAENPFDPLFSVTENKNNKPRVFSILTMYNEKDKNKLNRRSLASVTSSINGTSVTWMFTIDKKINKEPTPWGNYSINNITHKCQFTIENIRTTKWLYIKQVLTYQQSYLYKYNTEYKFVFIEHWHWLNNSIMESYFILTTLINYLQTYIEETNDIIALVCFCDFNNKLKIHFIRLMQLIGFITF